VIAFLGIGLFALPAGILDSRFYEKFRHTTEAGRNDNLPTLWNGIYYMMSAPLKPLAQSTTLLSQLITSARCKINCLLFPNMRSSKVFFGATSEFLWDSVELLYERD
jgi:hypothetical protein